ncbi:hypothetical protein F5880DRAFT_1511399, partial [Lentinula raphanica]
IPPLELVSAFRTAPSVPVKVWYSDSRGGCLATASAALFHSENVYGSSVTVFNGFEQRQTWSDGRNSFTKHRDAWDLLATRLSPVPGHRAYALERQISQLRNTFLAMFSNRYLGETEASSEELEELDVYQGSRVRTRAGTDLGTLRSSTTRPKPAKIGPPIGKKKTTAVGASKPSVTVSVKRERPEEEKPTVRIPVRWFLSPAPADTCFKGIPTPAPKRQKTGKAAGKARAVTPAPSVEVDELEPELVSEAAASSMALDQLLANDDRDVSRHVSFLTNPDYKPRIAFSTLVSPGHNLKRCPDHQVLRMPKWVATPELASVGSFLTAGNASFSISNLARFAHLTTRVRWIPTSPQPRTVSRV